MPGIKINEFDNTIYSSGINDNNNVVYVPGNAITGPSDAPVLCTTVEQFRNTFGNKSPERLNPNCITPWEYALSILDAGFPVLFKKFDEGSTAASAVLIENTATAVSEAETITLTGGSGKTAHKPVNPNALITATVNNNITVNEQFIADGIITLTKTVGNVTYTVTIDTTVTTTDASNITVSASGGGTISSLSLTYSYDTVLGTFEAIDTGVYGNSFTATFNSVTTSGTSEIYFVLTSGETQLESIGLGTNPTLANLINMKSAYVTFSASQSPTTPIDITNRNYTITNFSGGADLTSTAETAETDVSNYQAAIIDYYKELKDKYTHNVKFITGGGLDFTVQSTSTTIGIEISNLCQSRGDCFGFLDTVYGSNTIDNPDNTFRQFSGKSASYIAVYGPWIEKQIITGATVWCPGSFIFLTTLAKSVQEGNSIWDIPAGVRRMTVTDVVEPEYQIDSSLLNAWQNHGGEGGSYINRSINPIMKVGSYGYVIWGQRTLYFINQYKHSQLESVATRLVSIDVKKAIFNICLNLIFEQNNIHTWNEFTSQLGSVLAQMASVGAIYDYNIKMDSTVVSADKIDANTIYGIVSIAPTKAAEYFEIDFQLSPASVTLLDGEEVTA